MQPVNLHGELWRAVQFYEALPPPIQLNFRERFSRRVQWGFARVDFWGPDGRRYEPQVDGQVVAFIVPVVEGGETVDLAAIDPGTQHVGTRLGYGWALGQPAIDKARCGFDLKLMAHPLDWLRDPVESAYLFNLSTLPVALDGVNVIACASLELSDRVAALLPPSERHRAQVI